MSNAPQLLWTRDEKGRCCLQDNNAANEKYYEQNTFLNFDVLSAEYKVEISPILIRQQDEYEKRQISKKQEMITCELKPNKFAKIETLLFNNAVAEIKMVINKHNDETTVKSSAYLTNEYEYTHMYLALYVNSAEFDEIKAQLINGFEKNVTASIATSGIYSKRHGEYKLLPRNEYNQDDFPKIVISPDLETEPTSVDNVWSIKITSVQPFIKKISHQENQNQHQIKSQQNNRENEQNNTIIRKIYRNVSIITIISVMMLLVILLQRN